MRDVSADLVTRVETNPSLTDDDIDSFWIAYDEAFAPIRGKNPCRQHFHEAEFVASMRDTEFIKLVGYEVDRMVFFAMGTENLDKIPWIYREFYDERFPEFIGSRFYVPVIYIPLTLQGLRYSDQLLRAIQAYMRRHRLQMVLYDHGSAPPNSELTRIILRVPGTQLVGDGPIGAQLYRAVLTTLTEE
ncbi:MAG: hypothetical protein A3F35_03005 [Candidatus Woykebacteria bacterium RIFCSPHIGHO2_12_FULL_45_10]|uniref:GNAT family N-acetyltransferase n=1 Tax=Candidatus Woykebacteria bacterium RIFCSPHIGHO2_12_FULL_45_10 TaxID=1802603 RepID=A0A1G1WRL6_9BACT|nr:MAG: hypothetical protein A3F35_03005 [Candidatus Woykebacteria bacterium RIFCSPHIGHO2_12_FULL_45_10]